MNKKQFKEYIKEIIISEVTMVGPKTDINKSGEIAKTVGTDAPIVRNAIGQAKKTGIPVGIAEMLLNEMAGFYKVKDKAGFKKALEKYKELKGDKFDKNALGRLLVALDKEGEVNIKQFSQGKDPATYNNSNTRAALEDDGGEFTDYIEAGKSKTSDKEEPKAKKEEPKKETPKKEEPKVKKEAPKKETPKKETPKKEKKVKDEDEEEVEDNWNKSSDDDDMEDEKSIDKKAQAAAKKGGGDNTPEEKKIKFNQFLASIQKNKSDKAKVSGLLKIAKDKYDLPKTMMDDLLRAAGREVE
jgi:hypothetical protein